MFNSLLAIVLITLVTSAKSDLPTDVDGFRLLFTTNDQEMSDVEVMMDRPLPTWLRGLYIRNGPGQFEMGPRNLTHAFDGYGKLHSFRFSGSSSKMFYSTRFLRTHFYNESVRWKTVAPYLLFDGAEPPFTYAEKILSFIHGIDNQNVNIFHWGPARENQSTLVAISDFWQFYDFNSDSLHTGNFHNNDLPVGGDFHKLFPIPSSSHPLKEAGSDDYINFYSLLTPLPGPWSSINLFRIRSLNERELITSIPVWQVPYMHSFGLTTQYAILLAHPATIDVFTMLRTGSPLKSLVWHGDRTTDVYVIDITNGTYRVLHCPAFFFTHVVNAYEEGSDIILDAATYSDLSFFQEFTLDTIKSFDPHLSRDSFATLRRLRIDLTNGVVHVTTFPSLSRVTPTNKLDLPSINPNHARGAYCYVYGIVTGGFNGSLLSTCIVKKDVCGNGSMDKVWCREGHYPTEPWFEPRPNTVSEDDGVVLSLVLDSSLRKSYMLVLDARSLQEISIGVLPIPAPFTIHGRMFPNDRKPLDTAQSSCENCI